MKITSVRFFRLFGILFLIFVICAALWLSPAPAARRPTTGQSRSNRTMGGARASRPGPVHVPGKPVSRVHDSFKEDGTPNDPAYERRAAAFLDELLWFTEAIVDRKAKRT